GSSRDCCKALRVASESSASGSRTGRVALPVAFLDSFTASSRVRPQSPRRCSAGPCPDPGGNRVGAGRCFGQTHGTRTRSDAETSGPRRVLHLTEPTGPGRGGQRAVPGRREPRPAPLVTTGAGAAPWVGRGPPPTRRR